MEAFTYVTWQGTADVQTSTTAKQSPEVMAAIT